MPKTLDDWVICFAVSFGLLIALLLAILPERGEEYPPTIIAAFLGVAVAALTYRFLGGAATTEFSVGVLKLGGSAALLLGTIWFVGDRLRDEFQLYPQANRYREERARVEAERDAALADVRELKRRLTEMPTTSSAPSISEIKKLKPNDPVVQDIRRLVEGQEYPFVATLRDMLVRVTVIRTASDRLSFNVCGDTLDKLNEGVIVPNPTFRFSRTAEGHEPIVSTAFKSGKIGDDVCANPGREFDVQISCPLALKLFPDLMTDCAQGIAARGLPVSIGTLAD